MNPELIDDALAVRAAVTAARAGLVDRELVAEAVVLCAVAGEHLLVIGPPGTAKSATVRNIAGHLGPRRGIPRIERHPEHTAGPAQRAGVPARRDRRRQPDPGVRRRG